MGESMSWEDDFNNYSNSFKNDINSPISTEAIINLRYAIISALHIDPEKTLRVISLAKEWSKKCSKSGRADLISAAGNYLPNEIDREKRDLKGQMIPYADWCAYAFLVMGNAGVAKMKSDQAVYSRAITGAKELDKRMPLIKLEKWVQDIWQA